MDVVCRILVYCEPESYPEVNFTIQTPWKVVNGHPNRGKKTMILQQLFDHHKVVALGKCGLDRTIKFSQLCRQKEVFVRLLKLSRNEQLPVLHLRGTKRDLYSSDVHGRYFMLMEDACDPLQKIHVHCFMGRSDVVRTWLWEFPNNYLGVTAAIGAFNQKQLEGLQAIPLNNLSYWRQMRLIFLLEMPWWVLQLTREKLQNTCRFI